IIELFIPGVSRFQMRITGETHFDFAIRLESGLAAAEHENAIRNTEKRLREMLIQKRMENVKFNVVVVEDLPVNEKTGKFQLIVPASPKTSTEPADVAAVI
ncbi:MAG: hypothetical protein KJN90_03915, partial [Gammaproteobacteria bacterium]|nr:hypothetical protein [Gammaproteobacteria bacterium]